MGTQGNFSLLGASARSKTLFKTAYNLDSNRIENFKKILNGYFII